MPSYLARYEAGEREEVWAELVALGPEVRRPAVEPDATAVADETMRRAARNVDVLFAGLQEAGYRFAYPEWAREPP